MLSSKANREIKTDAETGSKYWSVKLDHVMFTWFDVPPNAVFAAHAHESEQITYVLEGELFFELEGQVHCLKKDDAIAIPSFVVHKVWTEAKGAIAIDSWSPVDKRY